MPTMKALVKRHREPGIWLEDVPVPEIGINDVLIRVLRTGICGTDLHILLGHMDQRVDVPAVIGHEMSGVIVEVGADVDGWRAGERVTAMPLVWDGTCPACSRGDVHVCENLVFLGIDGPGALQQTWDVPPEVLVRLPPHLDLAHAALAEPLAVAVHDVRRGTVDDGDRVVVIGAGPVGVLIAMVARARGAQVLLVEPDSRRRRLAGDLGFETRDVGDGLREGVHEWTGADGADVVFEVSGAASAALGVPHLARVRGRIVFVAIHPEPRAIDLHRVFWRELTLVGARVYERRDFEEAVMLLSDETLDVRPLVSSVVALDEASAAFDALARGEGMKVLVQVGDESSL